ncbi:mannose-1-phosphate guanylyltransferase/mannose-6-phosphate isomerase [Marinobacter salinus]|uniref:Alginate biosynthesis protein AlgA n=1 Tax=Marinobacter salinus TaxID=1874317 RepID=A0A1D9GHP9_9GAMM|nr:mannose-1-phosphate guanylyltransferase/mannose-6-phosphate isomerase [Marinobacter salinus]AOY87139.1 mannose-1-phosphate guanylyltransferase/mannose-6-phosphate isomerase [Marinobacter salinus]
MIFPVILAGGAGSRLWPLSRQLNPKQFLPLTGESTMLQGTVARLNGLDVEPPVVVCNDEHRFLVAEQLRACGVEGAQILLEPVGRNTAPAIALAATSVAKTNPDAVLLVLAADHVVKDEPAFRASVTTAVTFAEQGKLVTFGVTPTGPETGYGYIRAGSYLGEGVAELEEFVEKPSVDMAQAYIDAGGYTWNSGMFLFRADRYLQELERWRPDILRACNTAMEQASDDLTFLRIGASAFRGCPEESVDYAVMEKTDSAVVVEMNAGWSDIGSWSALWENECKDSQGNAVKGDVILQDAKNTLARADHRLVALVGVDDLVVVETKDAVLVAHKDSVQDVKKVVEAIKSDGRHEHMNHREVYRPWGVYDSVDNGQRYQVKRITVKPGAKLSVQMHHHRAEHWIVVSGTAKVTNGEENYLVTENQSTYIPVGQVHCLENPGVIPLELIEVQSGSYLGEDDIVRLKDQYGRK